jgi:hypothetical protein
MLRKSPVSAFQITTSTCEGTAESVVSFWRSLKFDVAYDIVKDTTMGICHSQGFAISAYWSHVRSLTRQCLYQNPGFFKDVRGLKPYKIVQFC